MRGETFIAGRIPPRSPACTTSQSAVQRLHKSSLSFLNFDSLIMISRA